jgi:hypothetical protein
MPKNSCKYFQWNDVWQAILHSATHQELKEKLKSEWSIYFSSKSIFEYLTQLTPRILPALTQSMVFLALDCENF